MDEPCGSAPPGVRVSGAVEDGVAQLAVHGELDLGTAQSVRDAVRDALDDGAREIALDLADVSFLDSTGLSVLLHAARDAERRRATLRTLCPPGSEPGVVIDLAGVGKLLNVERSQA